MTELTNERIEELLARVDDRSAQLGDGYGNPISCNDARALLTEVKELRETVAKLREALKTASAYMDHSEQGCSFRRGGHECSCCFQEACSFVDAALANSTGGGK